MRERSLTLNVKASRTVRFRSREGYPAMPSRHFGKKRRIQEKRARRKVDEDRISSARADIQKRVNQFRENQARLKRERDGYYDTMIEKVRTTEWNEYVTPQEDRSVARR